MNEGTPLLVSTTVWLSLVCYPAGLVGRIRPAAWLHARRVWTAGCVAFVVHVIAAYGLVYGWSHAVAVSETARQTAATTGVDSGLGLYLNFLFAIAWAVDASVWWTRPEAVRGRLPALARLVHLFFLFMILNGAFIFVEAPMRWLGLAITIVGVLLLWMGMRRPVLERAGQP